MAKKNEPRESFFPSEEPLVRLGHSSEEPLVRLSHYRRGKNEFEGQGGFIGDGPRREAATIAHRLEEPVPASDEAFRQGEIAARSAFRELRSKGGKKRARDKNRTVRTRYRRNDVLKELKAVFRENRSIRKAAAVRHLREYLNPACVDRTLENLFDKWKVTEKRIFPKRNEDESS
jgi:hypothetical protein